MISITARMREAPFLAAALERHPVLADLVAQGAFEEALACAQATDAALPLRQALRRRRDALALVVAGGDLAGAFPLERVVALLSNFADEALGLAIAAAIRLRAPEADPVGFAAVALGKHGSRELNYSSDIDPILLFDPDRLPRRDSDDAGEAAVRVARAVVDLLQARDADGYVFRVDLRLRPASEATPLAIPVTAAISHYESSALPWERVAFVRARAAAGDVALGSGFLAAIQPFVWRRSLDFGAIEELRQLSDQISDHYADRQALGPGYDLKRGRGGIRALEFFVQAHQLIHGGRDPRLRVLGTLDAIAALAQAGHVGADDAAVLADAYRLLRTIEHRLQMMEDRQTHVLPKEPEALDAVARLHGEPDGAALVAQLAPHVAAVAALFDGLRPRRTSAIPRSGAPLAEALARAGFASDSRAGERIAGWRSGRLRAVSSPAAVAAFERVLPLLIEAFGRAPDPEAALGAFDAMLERLPSAVNLFRLIEARPALLDILADIMAHAPTLAEALGSAPALLDRLVDASAFDPPGPVEALGGEMRSRGDLEQRLDRVRHIVGEHRFALGTQLVRGLADPVAVAAGYARVAEAAVTTIADAIVEEFEAAHGCVPQSELLVLALGRLGGGVLTHASDLDLIYLFTGSFDGESDGRRPLSASLYYNRLAQRLTGGLSAQTSAGRLYEVDTRLRPSGAKGPLIVSLDTFERYQRQTAWTWEHMALTRARAVYGSAAARLAVNDVMTGVLHAPRDPALVAADARRMRAELAAHKPPAGPLDVKLGEGGLVDLEFAVHVHQLGSGIGVTPDLAAAIDALSAAGLVEPGLGAAHALLTRLIVTLRLVAPGLVDVPVATRAVVVRACGARDWNDLLAQLAAARQCVSRCRTAALRGEGNER